MKSIDWPAGTRAAVTLTYDDGLPQHVDLVAPELNSRALRATFYPPINSDLSRRPDVWRAVSAAGHELGNHTIFHPCRRSADMTWLPEWLDLAAYDLARLRTELDLANRVLDMVDPGSSRSYGNTCGEKSVGPASDPISMTPVLRELFVGARGGAATRPARPWKPEFDVFDVGTCGGDGFTFEQLVASIDAAADVGGWTVLMFHGVGPSEHELHVEEAVHRRFLDHLANREDLWVAPFRDVAGSLLAT